MTRVVVIGGGESAERDVSLASAASISAGLAAAGLSVEFLEITATGRWRHDDRPVESPWTLLAGATAFPAVHGPRGEDGTLQGLLELRGIPYVGPGVLASALCMDKVACKTLLAGRGVAQTRWAPLGPDGLAHACRFMESAGGPVFVKPANMGSSIGITRVDDPQGLDNALAGALRYDDLAVIEAASPGTELSCSILGAVGATGYEASVPSQTVPNKPWLDYADKYGPGSANAEVPARISAELAARVQDLARSIAALTRIDGLARVDLFHEVDGDRLLVNEVNTMPGFTADSTFPRMWAASGLAYPELLERLIELARQRHSRPRRTSR